jgi:hypothetical protein
MCHSCKTSYHHAQGHATGTTNSWNYTRIDLERNWCAYPAFAMFLLLLFIWKSGGKNENAFLYLWSSQEWKRSIFVLPDSTAIIVNERCDNCNLELSITQTERKSLVLKQQWCCSS